MGGRANGEAGWTRLSPEVLVPQDCRAVVLAGGGMWLGYQAHSPQKGGTRVPTRTASQALLPLGPASHTTSPARALSGHREPTHHETSPDADSRAAWSWTSSLQSCRHKNLFSYRVRPQESITVTEHGQRQGVPRTPSPKASGNLTREV